MNDISWTVSTEHEPWQTRAGLGLGEVTGMPDVFIGAATAALPVEGFGASFNELGWLALAALDESQRELVLREFFAPGVGLNFTLCRMPVGANDFSPDWYSYDEVADDFDLAHFSLANDDDTLVPFIHAAQAHQPELRLWASPWSPPTWMKTNGHYAAAMPIPGFQDVENGLRPDQVGAEGTDLMKQDDAHLRAYADYFGRFVDEYARRGIAVGMVMPQNEFNSAQPFPSCTWTPGGLARFIRHLGPRMHGRGVEIFLGTLERADDGLVGAVLDDPEAAQYIDGFGVQWHGKGALPYLHRDHPSARIYQTEQECGDGNNDWRYCRYAWTLMKHYFAHGATGYMYWNMALEEGGLSRWGWAQNSLVVVDAAAREFRFTPEFYLLKHVSHFVEPGALAVETLSYTGFENQLVFRNPDGALVIVAHNDSATEQPISILVDGRALTAALPADSFNTFVIPATPAS